jgi:hypothetical protein
MEKVTPAAAGQESVLLPALIPTDLEASILSFFIMI